MTLLSGDGPRGRALQILVALIVLALLLAPFLFPGAKALNTAAKTCVMILLVASYDLLLGYTGIVSFAHVMFFGAGAYGVGLALYGLGASWLALAAGLAAAFVLSLALALAIGLFSLRVQSIFFAMVTLAVAYAFNVLASQLSDLTGGEDGRSFIFCCRIAKQSPVSLTPGAPNKPWRRKRTNPFCRRYVKSCWKPQGTSGRRFPFSATCHNPGSETKCPIAVSGTPSGWSASIRRTSLGATARINSKSSPSPARVGQGGGTVGSLGGQPVGVGGNGNGGRFEQRATTTLLAELREVER